VLAAVGALAADGEAPDAVDLYPEIFFPEAFLQSCRRNAGSHARACSKWRKNSLTMELKTKVI